MPPARTERAAAAALAVAARLGLDADDATVLNASNKVTVLVRPCETLARVAPASERVAQFELDLAQALRESPVAAPDPRVEPAVHEHDGFAVTLWTYYEPLLEPLAPADYADALARLHAGMRAVDLATPHFTDRVAEAQALLADRDLTPGLPEPDRALLAGTLADLRRSIVGRGAPEQVLHGEPHPLNLLATAGGPRFVDFETCCRGPVEFDLAHAPGEVADHYPGLDPGLLRECRMLMLAMITTWRWDRGDALPDGRRLAAEWLAQLRAALEGPSA